MGPSSPPPKKIHEDCKHPEEITWVRGARRLVVSLIILAVGSVGGAAVSLVTLASQAAELRADVRHLAERQQELRSQVSSLGAADHRIESEGATASQQILVQLGTLSEQVRAIDTRLQRLEEGPTRRSR